LTWQPEVTAHWDLLFQSQYFESFVTVYGKSFRYGPPETTLPILITRPIVALRCESDNAPTTWRYAGLVRREIRTASQAEPLAKLQDSARKLTLGATNILNYSDLPEADAYSLVLVPAKWLPDIRVTLWEYRGPIGSTHQDELEAARVDLVRIEAKIDALG
jgi:hypothetical protein